MAGPHLRMTTLARRWRADRRGAAAVEFAMIALPFCFMIFAIIQLALHFMVQVTLDNATALAARELRTGHDASGNPVVADGGSDTLGKQAFMNTICSNMSWLQSQCAANLTVDVQTLSSFGAGPASSPTFSTSGAASGACFNSGNAGSAVELRAYYNWKMITQVLMQSLQTSGMNNGISQIRSTEVFQVEPNGQVNSSSSC